jgi:signal transduction histidine kinase
VNLVPSSLRQRLVLGAVAVGLLFSTLFAAAAVWLIHHAEDQAVHAALLSRVELARDEVAPDGSLAQDAGSPKTDLVQVVRPDGDVRASSTALTGLSALVTPAQARSAPGGFETQLQVKKPDIELAVRAVPIHLSGQRTSPPSTGLLVVAVDVEGFNTATSDLLVLLIAGLAIVVLAMAALSWTVTGRALHSVTRLTESAETLEPRSLAAGLPIPRRDAELGRLVSALNRMLARLHESHATELTFAADAGHRLRTPIAALRAEAELALREGDPEERTAALGRIVLDADQLTSVVERMLARSRSRDHLPEPVLTTLERAMPRWRRHAELDGIELTVIPDPQIGPEVRCAELVEVTEPIVDNALRHTPAGGVVTLGVRLDPSAPTQVMVDISNSGSPVSADIAPHIFDAWVSSRDASTAGGLGLWLARETSRDLGGDVTLLERGPGMTTFRVRLPIFRTHDEQWVSRDKDWHPHAW